MSPNLSRLPTRAQKPHVRFLRGLSYDAPSATRPFRAGRLGRARRSVARRFSRRRRVTALVARDREVQALLAEALRKLGEIA